jgi:hypothetical protein
MDTAKLQQAVEAIRRHLATGDRDAAVALYRETMGVDQEAAALAVEQVAASEPLSITKSVELNTDDVDRQVGQTLAAVPGGALAGTAFRFAGLDLSKIAGEGQAKTMHMALPTMRLPGSGQRDAPLPADAGAERPAPTPDDRPGHVSVLDRRHGPAFQRSRGRGLVGFAVVLLVLAAATAMAVILLRRS